MTISRKWVLPIAIGAFICSGIMAYVIDGVSMVNFHYATRVIETTHFPYPVILFKPVYNYVWLLPVLTALFGTLIVTHKITGETMIASIISVLIVIHVCWFFFWLVAIYLSNQSFIAMAK
jgi:hypothetical protein